MKKYGKIICTLLLTASFGIPGICSDNKDPFHFLFSEFFMHNLPGGYFYGAVIENYLPDTVFLIEESNGFSLLDNPRVYYEGDSQVNFNWRYNDFNINSVLNQGAPAVILPFLSLTSLQLQSERPDHYYYGMNFRTNSNLKNVFKVNISTVYSDLGGYSPWGPVMVYNHAENRDEMLYDTRRKILNNSVIDLLYTTGKRTKNFLVALSYFRIDRQFNDFNQFNKVYRENGGVFLLSSRYSYIESENNALEIIGILNLKERSNLNSELGRYPEETFSLNRISSFLGLKFKKSWINFSGSVIFERENIEPSEENFPKDLFDIDGEGLTLNNRIGLFKSSSISCDVNFPVLTQTPVSRFKLEPFFNFNYSTIYGEEKPNLYNEIFFDKTPYLILLWDNQLNEYQNNKFTFQGGFKSDYKISEDISLLLKTYIAGYNFNFEREKNSFSSLNFSIDAGLFLFKKRKSNLLVSFGIIPYDGREHVSFFLESNRPFGTYYKWDDSNADNTFQSNEVKEVFGYTGGKYHNREENLTIPVKNRFLIMFNTKLSPGWNLSIKGLYKTIKNNYRVIFKDNYGIYENINNYNLFFFDKPFKDYTLSNTGYERDPFYAQLHFTIRGNKERKWFFVFSFMAHIGMGYTSFGNGAATSDIGLIDESQANPNSLINCYGRVDGDRAFVAKSYFGFYIFKNFFVAVNLKYRDGNPFTFFDTLYNHDQYVMYYSSIKAEDEKGNKPGPREDYLSEFNIKFNYLFKLFGKKTKLSVSFFNLLDFGSELSEYVYDRKGRNALELQIPRSIRLSLQMEI